MGAMDPTEWQVTLWVNGNIKYRATFLSERAAIRDRERLVREGASRKDVSLLGVSLL